jgi:hypothetical protein
LNLVNRYFHNTLDRQTHFIDRRGLATWLAFLGRPSSSAGSRQMRLDAKSDRYRFINEAIPPIPITS